MKLSITLLSAFVIMLTFQVKSQCYNENVVVEKLYCEYCPDEESSSLSSMIRTLHFEITDDGEGNEMIAIVIILEEGTADLPHYAVVMMFPKSKFVGGVQTIQFDDSWNTAGLDNDNTAIAKFQYWNGETYTTQWSNWGAHIEGASEGTLTITKMDSDEMCGSFSFTAYQDGSSSDENKKSIVSCKQFHALLNR